MIHRRAGVITVTGGVVNCFQNCIFSDDSQVHVVIPASDLVVNCFQNCIFSDDSQVTVLKRISVLSCELLSKLYF